MKQKKEFNKINLAIAPIGWTNDDDPSLGGEISFRQCISEMALAGFSGCEVGSKYPVDDIKLLTKELSLRNLSICNQWFSAFFTGKDANEKATEEAFRKQCQFLMQMGAKRIGACEVGTSIQGQNVPIFKGKYVFSDKEFNDLANGLNKLGKIALEEYNIELVYHHHMGTGVQTLEETNKLMSLTDPKYVNLLYDTGHIYLSDGSMENTLKLLYQNSDRIKHVHLKDVRGKVKEEVINKDLSFLDGVRKGVFTVPGDGEIYFDPIFDFLKSINYEGWFVVEAEQDPNIANPLEYALKARKFISEKTGI